MCVYKSLEQTYTHAHSYICCIFCSTVPHPSKNDVVALVPQRLQPVEHWFHTCSSSSTLQRQVIRIFLVIQINCGQPQAKTFCWDAIDPLASGICPSTRFDKILLLQIGDHGRSRVSCVLQDAFKDRSNDICPSTLQRAENLYIRVIRATA